MYVWRDVDNIPGDIAANTSSWRDAVDRALRESTHMIVVLSPDAVASSEVKAEWNSFLKKGRPVIPVLHRDCDIPYRLEALNYWDLRDRYADGLNRLADTLRSMGSTSPRPMPKLSKGQRAPKPASPPKPEKKPGLFSRVTPLLAAAIFGGVAVICLLGCLLWALANGFSLDGASANFPSDSGYGTLYVYNYSSTSICSFHYASAGTGAWSANQLAPGTSLPPTYSSYLTLPSGSYDFQARDCSNFEIETAGNVFIPVNNSITWEVTGY